VLKGDYEHFDVLSIKEDMSGGLELQVKTTWPVVEVVQFCTGKYKAIRGKTDDRNGFELRAHIGNHALFITGVFPDRIRVRAEKRGFPDLRYFEGLGQSSFRAASDHHLAQRYDLVSVFGTLGERFRAARQALNDLSERLLAWDDDRYALPMLASTKLLN
jgi:hypothetical protein